MIRLLPPSVGPTSININGRTISCAVGSTVDVSDADGMVMIANGWITGVDPELGPNGPIPTVGPTAQRPVLTQSQRGITYSDTTTGNMIVWDGKTWRNPVSGASV